MEYGKKQIIALVDCDSFFVGCEQSQDESLIGKPVCVTSGEMGCVLSRSREAKKMGIPMGYPYFKCKKEFPLGVYVTANYELYHNISKQVMEILHDFSPTVQIYSIDEAFLDLSGLRRMYGKNYYRIAEDIKKRIKDETGVDVSIGLATSKTLAKLASHKAKSQGGGIYIVGKRKIERVVKDATLRDVWGIGKNLEKCLARWGILKPYDLFEKSDEWLKAKFGKRGVELKHELMGETVSPVTNKKELPKSIQNTSALGKFTDDIDFIKNALNYHIHKSCSRMRRLGLRCGVIGVMLRTKDFQIFYTKKVLPSTLNLEFEVGKVALELLDEIYKPEILYRSTGIVLENLTLEQEEQLFLFDDNEEKIKKQNLARCIDNIERKFGKNKIKTGFLNELNDNKPDKIEK